MYASLKIEFCLSYLELLQWDKTSRGLNFADHYICNVLIFLRQSNFADGPFRNVLQTSGISDTGHRSRQGQI